MTSPATRAARARALWTVGIVIATVAVLVLADRRGLGSRNAFRAPPALASRPVAAVGSAAEAFVVWRGSELKGRRFLLLTGQWGSPLRSAGSAGSAGGVTAASAAYWAARLGLARSFDVVMPPAAFEERRAEDATHPQYRPEPDAFRHDLHGFRLRFSLPGAVARLDEPVVVLVEPTWFRAGAPPDPLAWLSSAGLRTDLALVALDDPAATDADRRAAADYVRAARIPRLEIEMTP
ncbi:MAG TPA: hypothetical protein VFM45_02400 [Anaeromyxobacteraceae bacterium]|nr:hypothetical protein [Anaeromyxobacteraceae bacterium]